MLLPVDESSTREASREAGGFFAADFGRGARVVESYIRAQIINEPLGPQIMNF